MDTNSAQKILEKSKKLGQEIDLVKKKLMEVENGSGATAAIEDEEEDEESSESEEEERTTKLSKKMDSSPVEKKKKKSSPKGSAINFLRRDDLWMHSTRKLYTQKAKESFRERNKRRKRY